MVVRLTPRQAAALMLPDPVERSVSNRARGEPLEQAYDASRIFDHEPIGHTTEIAHAKDIEGRSYLSLDAALKQTNRELHSLVYVCNRAAWGSHDWKIMNAPTKQQLEEVPQMLSERMQLFPNLKRKARQAHITRAFAVKLAEALEGARAAAVADMQARADADNDKQFRAEFDALESVAKEYLYQAWRKRRCSSNR